MESPPNIYALLVGINEYQKVRKLSGCINDVIAVEDYLLNDCLFNAKIEKITDSAATREGIAAGFRNHLAKANKNDTVLFYYSGHGTQEIADPDIWKEETDGTLECIVCYDKNPGVFHDFLMTDKELRFLINELSVSTEGAHIVTIFDCCNSGDNTRNGALMKANFEEVNERNITRSGDFFPKRDWEQFLFSDELKKTDTIAQGAHVQMAACESNQTALEIGKQGVFTKTLLKVLRDCGGNISYNALRSRIRQYMRANFEQTPRIYIPLKPEEFLEKGFLNKKIESQKMLSEALFNTKDGWILNIGAIHGLDEQSKIKIFPPKSKKPIVVSVTKGGVFVDYTKLNITTLDQNLIYKAEIDGIMTEKLVFEIENQDARPDEINDLLAILSKSTKGTFVLGGESAAEKTEKDSGKAEMADYTMHIRCGEVYFTKPNDPFRPLIKPLLFFKNEQKLKLAETVLHLSRWHYIKNLENKAIPEDFPAEPLKIMLSQIKKSGETEEIKSGDFINYEKNPKGWDGKIQIEVTNTTDQELYFCAAYLSKEFQCFLDFLPQRVQKLEAGKSLFLGFKGATSIKLGLSDVIKEYNWEAYTEHIKFIISTTEFDAEALTLEALAEPLTTARDRSADEATDKSLITSEDEPTIFSGWLTQRLDFQFRNPVFNLLPQNTLQTMLEDEETAYFAMNLYCEVFNDEFGEPTNWQLKKGLNLPEEEKGLLQNVLLFLGNKIETAQRRKRYRNLKQDPSRLRIVAEGDSWFQYPIKLKDVLDQLYKRYAIKSYAEAGDTLKNYLIEKEYLNAVGEEGAAFFLVSGGGNDIIGEKFKTFLNDSPDPTETGPKRYLNLTFFQELDNLETLFSQMFSELINRYPNLNILVHCYDYVIPVDTSLAENNGNSSWSGKFMVEKGIKPQAEREALIKFILDQFADKIKALTQLDNFKNNVSFIDTRGIVNRNSWFDEIHPTNAGFELVANKFFEVIEAIQRKTVTS